MCPSIELGVGTSGPQGVPGTSPLDGSGNLTLGDGSLTPSNPMDGHSVQLVSSGTSQSGFQIASQNGDEEIEAGFNTYTGSGAPPGAYVGTITDHDFVVCCHFNNLFYVSKNFQHQLFGDLSGYATRRSEAAAVLGLFADSGNALNFLSCRDESDTELAKIGLDGKATFAGGTAFTPATPGDWNTSPATVHAALNELAARIKALEP